MYMQPCSFLFGLCISRHSSITITRSPLPPRLKNTRKIVKHKGAL
jgi:hypothetical protein